MHLRSGGVPSKFDQCGPIVLPNHWSLQGSTKDARPFGTNGEILAVCYSNRQSLRAVIHFELALLLSTNSSIAQAPVQSSRAPRQAEVEVERATPAESQATLDVSRPAHFHRCFGSRKTTRHQSKLQSRLSQPSVQASLC